MFKKGQLVIVDADKFYHFYKLKLLGSDFNKNFLLKSWINNLDKITDGTRVLKIGEIQKGNTIYVETLNGEDYWYLSTKVLIPCENTFYHLECYL